MRGIDEKRIGLLMVACAFAALSALSKYFGITLIPLFAAYAIMRTRRPGWWLATLLIPIAMLASFEGYTKAKYDRGLIVDAMKYAARWRWTEGKAATKPSDARAAAMRSPVTKTLTSLAFAGGCCATVALIVLFTGRWPFAVIALVTASIVLALLLWRKPFEHILGGPAVAAQPPFRAQMVIYATLAVVMLAGLIGIWWRNRDAQTTTLLLWLCGALVFAGYINWTVNGRSILPMAPPAAILAARATATLRWRRATWGARAGLAMGGAVAIAVCCADVSLARSSREAAERFRRRADSYAGRLWFQGHWGFQYYMQQFGFSPIDSRSSHLKYADVVFWPQNSTNKVHLPFEYLREIDYFKLELMPRVSTMDRTAGSGFYCDAWGPLPFAFGPVAAEEYAEFQVMTNIQYQP
jgi:hypothetical protein